MRNFKALGLTLILAMAGLLAACDNEGPAEQAGEKIDEAVEETQEAAEEAKEDIKDATN